MLFTFACSRGVSIQFNSSQLIDRFCLHSTFFDFPQTNSSATPSSGISSTEKPSSESLLAEDSSVEQNPSKATDSLSIASDASIDQSMDDAEWKGKPNGKPFAQVRLPSWPLCRLLTHTVSRLSFLWYTFSFLAHSIMVHPVASPCARYATNTFTTWSKSRRRRASSTRPASVARSAASNLSRPQSHPLSSPSY